MKRKAIFTSNGLIEEIKRKTNNKQKEVFIEDMVDGVYYRCFGVVEDKDGSIVLRAKSLIDLMNGVNDLYEE